MLPDLRGGGAERVSIDLARALTALGHKVEFVLMTATGEFLSEVQQEFPVEALQAFKTRQVPLRLSRYLRERRPDALIANMWSLTSAAVLGRALSRHRCRLLLVEHSTLSQQYAKWGYFHNLMMQMSLTATHRWADRVAAVSEGAARDVAQLAGLRSRRVAVLHNPIPLPLAPTDDIRAKVEVWWGGPQGRRILTVGSLKDQKNHALLLRAFARIAGSNARLMVLGQGPNEPMLRQLAEDLDVADRVVFAGFHVDPSPFYATADVFVLSSDYEGLPTVLIEALSYGLPIVSTDCPSGAAEILENGRWGHLVPVGDAGALARAMGTALAAPVNCEALKRRAADFAPAKAASRYLELLFEKGETE